MTFADDMADGMYCEVCGCLIDDEAGEPCGYLTKCPDCIEAEGGGYAEHIPQTS